MSRKLEDLTDQRFGHLIVIERVANRVSPSGVQRTFWRCLCDCGEESNVAARNLVDEHVRSCGCRGRDKGERSARTEQFDRPPSLELGDLDVDIVPSSRSRHS